MTETDLCYLSALQLRELYLKHEVSPVEVTEAVLRRMDQLNPRLNAFITTTPELALEGARRAEQAYRTDESPPPLAGVPTSIKDLVGMTGIRTTRGSLRYKDSVSDFDAPIIERFHEAGAVMLGKTNMPEFGWKGDSTNRIIGSTHNPWKHGRTAGGSSGGGTAALAAGLGPLAQGSDGAGSIRIPASFCGIYGLKPSWGIIPQYPPSAVELLSHIGPMTRTVTDAALMLNVMVGADPRDRLSIPTELDYLAALEGDIARLRVAWSPDLGYAAVDPEVREIVTKAALRFEELGYHVEEAHPGLEDPWEDIVHIIWGSTFAGLHLHDLDTVRDQIDPGLVRVIEQGLKLSGAAVAIAYAKRNDYYDAWRQFMERYDLLLTPALPVTAFPLAMIIRDRLTDNRQPI